MHIIPTNTDPVTVYVELLDEGIRCVRPTLAVLRGDDEYLLMATPGYDADDEHWEVLPGSIVRIQKELWDGKSLLVARAPRRPL